MSEPWQQLAYRLWRRRGMSWVEVSAHLASEGWEVSPQRVADVVLGLVGEQLAS